VVVPYPCKCLSSTALLAIDEANHKLERQLSIVAVPNDSIRHIGEINPSSSRIICVKSTGVHRYAVAEYVIAQLVMHSRGLADIALDTIDPWHAGHLSAVSTSHQLRGKTLGVLGASGLDGSAVVELALAHGMHVVSNRPRSREGAKELEDIGVKLTNRIQDVFEHSSCLAIHLRLSLFGEQSTRGCISTQEITALPLGALVVNTAGADLFDKGALFSELDASRKNRHISRLIVDMPFVDSDGQVNWDSEDNCRLRSYEHVIVTPRISGYTVEARLAACRQVAEAVIRYFQETKN
jgi:phosphoglycerate dehydrogenase-like enzyme